MSINPARFKREGGDSPFSIGRIRRPLECSVKPPNYAWTTSLKSGENLTDTTVTNEGVRQTVNLALSGKWHCEQGIFQMSWLLHLWPIVTLQNLCAMFKSGQRSTMIQQVSVFDTEKTESRNRLRWRFWGCRRNWRSKGRYHSESQHSINKIPKCCQDVSVYQKSEIFPN